MGELFYSFAQTAECRPDTLFRNGKEIEETADQRSCAITIEPTSSSINEPKSDQDAVFELRLFAPEVLEKGKLHGGFHQESFTHDPL